MNISHSRFILFKLKIIGEIVTTVAYLLLLTCTVHTLQFACLAVDTGTRTVTWYQAEISDLMTKD